MVKENREKINQIEVNIRDDLTWYNKIHKEAITKKMDADTLVLIKAINVFKENRKKNNSPD